MHDVMICFISVVQLLLLCF